MATLLLMTSTDGALTVVLLMASFIEWLFFKYQIHCIDFSTVYLSVYLFISLVNG